MRCSVKTVFYVTLAVVLGSNAFAQRGFGGLGGIRGPSSTAIGLGAVPGGRAAVPSSTAVGAGSPVRSNGFYRGGFASGIGGYNPGTRNGRGSRTAQRASNFRGDYRRVPYEYFLSPYYYPFLDYGSAPYGGAPEDLPEDPNPVLMQNALGQQVERLTAEIAQLKYGQQPAAQMPAAPLQPEPPPPQVAPITLVLRNGQKLQVQNYAVMDQTFWDFSKQPARKIPVSSIDVSASSQATAASGAEFPQIGSRE